MSRTFTSTAVLDVIDREDELVEINVEVNIDYYDRYQAETMYSPEYGGEMQFYVFDAKGNDVTGLVSDSSMERLEELAWEWVSC